jgi:hypothetical protein
MAQYVVFTTRDVPELGQTGTATLYRGDHATEIEAVDAAAAVLTVKAGDRLWAVLASVLVRYVATVNVTYGSAVG